MKSFIFLLLCLMLVFSVGVVYVRGDVVFGANFGVEFFFKFIFEDDVKV